MSFWFPFQVVGDVLEGSRASRPSVELGVWWAAWLIYLGTNNGASQLTTSSEVSMLGALPAAQAVATVTAIVSGVLWCRLVQRITAGQAAALQY